MGTCIESVATATNRNRLVRRGALHLIDSAAKECLHRAGREARQLDLVINAGIYKNVNTAEPALAAIVQEDIGANPGASLALGHGTFSFDVIDGGCGVVTAVRLAETFVGSGTAKRGLIVAGDVDPSPRTSHGFHFAPAAGALLLAHTSTAGGFEDFESHTFPDYADLWQVSLRWSPHAGWLRRGRNVIEVHEDPQVGARCTELAAEVVTQFLKRRGLAPADIDLLITSQYPQAVARELGPRIGISDGKIPHVRSALSRTHTAGPIAALEAAFESGLFGRATRTLFVTVGAGLAVSVALYVDDTSAAH